VFCKSLFFRFFFFSFGQGFVCPSSNYIFWLYYYITPLVSLYFFLHSILVFQYVPIRMITIYTTLTTTKHLFHP
jgi:hypothetical protein